MNLHEQIRQLNENNDPYERIKIADEILEEIPFELNALVTKGYSHIEIEQFPEAIDAFEKAIEFDSHYIATPSALNGIGVCYARQENYKEALKYFEKCYKLDKKVNSVIFNIAYMHFNLGNYEKALEKFEEDLKINPDNIITQFKIEEIKNGGELEFKSIPDALMKAQMYHQAYKYDEALKIYQQIINIQNDCIPAYNNQGLIYRELNQPQKAIECYKKAVKYQPKAQVAWAGMAMTYLEMGDFLHASECYDKALELNSEDDVSLANNAFCLMRIGEFDRSIEMSKRSLELNPSPEAYANIAYCYELQEEYEKAIEVYDEGLENFESITLYNNKAWSLKMLNRYEEALQCYNKAYELERENPLIVKNIAIIYKEMDDLDKAHEYYDMAYEMNPTIGSFDEL